MTPYPWTPAADRTLARAWSAKEPVETIAATLGCTDTDVRVRAVVVLNLPARVPIDCERASRAGMRRGA